LAAKKHPVPGKSPFIPSKPKYKASFGIFSSASPLRGYLILVLGAKGEPISIPPIINGVAFIL
jgi:hypothetical protein